MEIKTPTEEGPADVDLSQAQKEEAEKSKAMALERIRRRANRG